ncbi:MAG: NADH-quinone oxidoreductase subunit NuoK [Actinomycetota bacterium]|jgi:NADH-quinone oxidoreductase subunit K|nr:NADH-quinone oxidoreductase subunit NuoK [Actinomycetota bacterium]|tara:strand:- start:368 stop:673 length:306 start_codon:yes stop_codon:yes gene_type:complete
MNIVPILVTAAALFSLGIYGILVRRNAVMVLLAIELMLNSVNINFILFDAYLRDTLLQGQIFSIFIITVAAAEVGIGLAIVLMVFRNRQTANLNDFDLLKW